MIKMLKSLILEIIKQSVKKTSGLLLNKKDQRTGENKGEETKKKWENKIKTGWFYFLAEDSSNSSVLIVSVSTSCSDGGGTISSRFLSSICLFFLLLVLLSSSRPLGTRWRPSFWTSPFWWMKRLQNVLLCFFFLDKWTALSGGRRIHAALLH